MYCTKCGCENSLSANYCRNCGKALGGNSYARAEVIYRKTWKNDYQYVFWGSIIFVFDVIMTASALLLGSDVPDIPLKAFIGFATIKFISIVLTVSAADAKHRNSRTWGIFALLVSGGLAQIILGISAPKSS